MTANGQPDNARAARYILKDFITGKLLFCNSPPSVPQEVYHIWPERQKSHFENRVPPPRAVRAGRVSEDVNVTHLVEKHFFFQPYHMTTEDLDKGFFSTASNGVHTKGVAGKFSGFSKRCYC